MKIKRKSNRTLTTQANRNERWEIMRNMMAPWVLLDCNIPEATMQDLQDASEATGATIEQIVFVAISQWISKHSAEDSP